MSSERSGEALNVEIKARCSNPERVVKTLKTLAAESRGTDDQTDTYFPCPQGRLKLRVGTIENALIHYHRPNVMGAKRSDVHLVPLVPDQAAALRETLCKALGVRVIVRKRRQIFFLDNVKIHVDDVAELGGFVEIEAQADSSQADETQLLRQCRTLMDQLGIEEA